MVARTFVPLLLTCSCAFLEAALELTVGAGEVLCEVDLPRPDELGLYEPSDVADVPDFPQELSDLTLAHVRGLLRLVGECSRTKEVSKVAAGPVLVTVDDCQRCGCGSFQEGLMVRASVPVILVDEAKAKGIREKLAEVSPDAILQVRLLVHELSLVRTDAHGSEPLEGYLSDFQVELVDDLDHRVKLVDHRYVSSVQRDNPQRFDLARDSEVFGRMVELLLQGQPVSMKVELTAVVPEAALYAFKIEGVRMRLQAQPEVIISALRAAVGA